MNKTLSLIKTTRTNRSLVLASIILAMFMAAIEGTIVATAMPSIVGELGGFSLFSWVFSSFLLAQAITIPIYGKLADLFGRKPVFTFGIVVFLFGSILCGYAGTMHMLIVFRLIQGIGAGAVQPIATTIIGDIYTFEERAKVQGYLSSVWGISSIVGPALGGIFVQYIHWSWVFWVNIPLGILSLLGIWGFLHEKFNKKPPQIDYLGSGLLFVSISALMVVLIQGGVTWAWLSAPMLLLTGIFVTCTVFFVLHEKKAPEPLMPFTLWKIRLIAISNIASFTTGAVMIGVTTFLPTYVQGIMGQPPTIAGFTLAMMSFGWPIASTFAGGLMIKYSYRATAIMGGVALLLGSLFFITLQPYRGPVWGGVGALIVGVGMGLATTTFVVSIQSSVDWQTRGVATASNMFMRILGNTTGAALLGGILNSRMSHYLTLSGQPLNLDITNTLLNPEKNKLIPKFTLDLLKEGLTNSLHTVYWGVFILAVLSLVLIFMLPKANLKE